VVSWWDQPPGRGYQQLSAQEAGSLRAFSRAAVPGGGVIALSGADAVIDRFFDAVLGGMPPLTVELLRLLMPALGRAPLLEHDSPFTGLPLPTQQVAPRRWFISDVSGIRGAISSLVVLLGMGYTTHPEVSPIMSAWHRCGYGR
jgi:hypothetical protein